MCLQAEADEDTGENIASGISNESHDVNSGTAAGRQVSIFISASFVILGYFVMHLAILSTALHAKSKKIFKLLGAV